jgi:hypothetical protein
MNELMPIKPSTATGSGVRGGPAREGSTSSRTEAGDPSLRRRNCRMERFIPSHTAAPCGPPSTHPVSPSIARMSLRSVASSVSCGVGGANATRAVNSVRGTCKTGPGERITARSMTFCSSRMLPGQAYRIKPCIVSDAMVSIVLCMLRANCCTKWRTSSGISSGRSRRGGTCTGKTLTR